MGEPTTPASGEFRQKHPLVEYMGSNTTVSCYRYDGKFLENAKEDAANVAMEKIEEARQLLLAQQQMLQQQPDDNDNDGGDGPGNNWQSYSRQ